MLVLSNNLNKEEKKGAMGILSWIIMGLIVGVLAKLIMPGKDPGGFIITIFLGIVGAFLGGYIGSRLGFGQLRDFMFRAYYWLLAALSSC